MEAASIERYMLYPSSNYPSGLYDKSSGSPARAFVLFIYHNMLLSVTGKLIYRLQANFAVFHKIVYLQKFVSAMYIVV